MDRMLRRLLRPGHHGEATPTRRRLLRWLGWFGVANTALLILVSLRNLSVTDVPEGFLPRAFLVLMLVGHNAVLAFLAAVPAALLALAWPRRGPLVGLATALSAALVYAALIDTVVFLQYRFHLNAEIFNLLFGGAADEILVFSTAMYLQAAALLVGVVIAELLLGSLVWRLVRRHRGGWPGRAATFGLAAAFVAQTSLHAWADLTGYIPVTRQGRVLLAYVPVTAETLLTRLGFESRRGDAPLREADHGSALAYPRKPLECSPPDELPSILFLIIDGWRFDALTPDITPRIHGFSARTLRFEDHLSGGSATRTGIFSMFYGIPGTYWHAALAEQRGPVLVSELYEHGYDVAIFASAKLINPELHRTVFAEVPDLRLRSDGETPSERDRDSTRDFVEFLDSRREDRPFFSMLFYDAPHGYDVPPGFPQPFQPSWDEVNYLALHDDFDPAPFHNRYLNAVHFNDALVGTVLDALDARGLIERTLIVFTGDHGQEFNENGLNYWGHDSNFSRYQVAVPLLIHWPGREPAVYSHRTSHYDIAPTLLGEVLGCTNDPADHSVGRSLLEAGGRETLLLANYTDYALVQPDRIVAVYPYGVEVLDERYRPIPDAKLEKRVMLEALELRSRFYR